MKRLIIALLVACASIAFLLPLGSGGQVLRLSDLELERSGSNTGHSLTFSLQPSTLKSLLSSTFNLRPWTLPNGQSSTGGTGGTSSGGIGSSTVSGGNVRSLESIAVTPANATIYAGSTLQYTATGSYSDGSQQNITLSVTWGSTNTALATIASGGLATAVAAGSTTIQAALSGITGSTGLTVSAPSLVSIAMTPANATVYTGSTQ